MRFFAHSNYFMRFMVYGVFEVPNKLTQEEFIARCINKHGGKYGYNKVRYINSSIKVEIVCFKHGDFSVTPNHHMRGVGCSKCGHARTGENRRNSVAEFIANAKKVHGDRYDYSRVHHIKNNKAKLTIVCRVHGGFLQSANNHVSKAAGCFECANLIKGGYERSRHIASAKQNHNGLSNLYVIKCFDDKDEIFYKIGITQRDVKRRFYGKKIMPYKYEIVRVFRGEAGFVWDMEKRLHKICLHSTYAPKIRFFGSTECFSKIPKQVLKLIDEMKTTDQLQLIA